MPSFLPPGAYAATGLPREDYDLFRVWLFVTGDAALATNSRQYDTVAVARTLMKHGEKKLPVLAAALLATMPRKLAPIIARRFGQEVADVFTEVALHDATRFAYIDNASPAAQKVALALGLHGIAFLQDHGQKQIESFYEALQSGRAGDSMHISLLTPPRYFMLLADKTAGTTGNDRLENIYMDEAYTYTAYYRDYLQQLLSFESLPASARQQVGLRLRPEAEHRPVEATALWKGTWESPQALYDRLKLDPRLTPAALSSAAEVAAVLLDSGESTNRTACAALLIGAFGGLIKSDQILLAHLGWRPEADIARAATLAQAREIPVAARQAPLQQIELAKATALYKAAIHSCEKAEKRLSQSPETADPAIRQHYAAQLLLPFRKMTAEHKANVMPALASLPHPALVEELKAQFALLVHTIDRAEAAAHPAGLLTPRPQRPPGGPKPL
jgi:hypothetical protein